MQVDLEFALDLPPPLPPEQIELIRAGMDSDGPTYTTDEVRLGLPDAVSQTAEEIEAEFRHDLRELIESIDEQRAGMLIATVPIPTARVRR